MQYIGIDVSKRRVHGAWLRDPQRGLIKTKASDNTPEGHALLLAWAQRVSGAAPGELCFVLEATGVYHEALALFLHQAGCQVAVTNPLHVKRFAESHGIRTKNDHQDGRVLALYGKARRPQAWEPPPHVRDLRALLRRLPALEEDLQREANRLEKARIEGAPQRVIASLQSMQATLKQHGTEKMVVNRAADWGRSDPLKVPKTWEAMLAAGFSQADVHKVLFENPIRFFAPSGQTRLTSSHPHAEAAWVEGACREIAMFLKALQQTAEQLTPLQRWWRVL